MSKRKIELLIDDLDGSETDVETVPFSIAGQAYEIELGPASRAQLDAALQPYVRAARRVKRARRRAAP